MAKPLPDGFRLATPHIVVADGARAIGLHQHASGAREPLRRLWPDSSKVMYARPKHGDSMLMCSAANFRRARFRPKAAAPERLSAPFPCGDRRRV